MLEYRSYASYSFCIMLLFYIIYFFLECHSTCFGDGKLLKKKKKNLYILYLQPKSKSAEGRERRPPPESFTSYNKQVGESSIRPANPPPHPNYFYHPAFPTSASSNQPSPIGHTPPPMSRTSPRPDLASLKTMDPLQGRESPMLKMQPVDANSNPIHEHNSERLEVS